jgi:hypothetical protein
MDLFLLTSTHYLREGSRKQLIPWIFQSSVSCFLTIDSGFTTLTPNQLILGVFDIISSLHNDYILPGTLGSIFIIG